MTVHEMLRELKDLERMRFKEAKLVEELHAKWVALDQQVKAIQKEMQGVNAAINNAEYAGAHLRGQIADIEHTIVCAMKEAPPQ